MNAEQESKRAAVEASAWLARLESGEASAADRLAHARWLAASSVNREKYAAMQAILRLAGRLHDPQLLALAESKPIRWWQRLTPFGAEPRSAWAGAFAVILCIVLGGAWLALNPPVQTYSTHVGEARAITLADGSVATLNTDSVLRVPRWWLGTRRVELERGEAFFAVKRDPAQPFIVDAHNATVRVLGTQFNVRLDGAGGTVAVVEGRVELSATTTSGGAISGAGDAREILVAGEAAEYNSGGVRKQHQPRIDLYLAWRSGRLEFEGARLEELVYELNRYSRVKARIADEALGTLRFSGTFHIEHLPDLPRTLEATGSIRIAERDGEILLFAR